MVLWERMTVGRPDLQNACVAEGAHHVAHRQEIPQAPLKHRVVQAAVGEIGKGHAKAPQHFSRGEQPALGVPQSGAVGLRPLVQGTPQQHGDVQVFGKAGAQILRAKVAVGQKQPVHPGGPEFLQDLQPVVLVVEQALLVDVVNVHEVDAQLTQTLRDSLPAPGELN